MFSLTRYFGLYLIDWNRGAGPDVQTIKSKVAPGALIITVDNGIGDIEAVDELHICRL